MLLIILAFIAFISLGLPDGLLGVAWPSIRFDYHEPFGSLGGAISAGVIGYLCSSFFSGYLRRIFGYGNLLVISNLLVSLSLWGIAQSSSFRLFLCCVLLLGAGGGAIDATVNSYAASNFSARIVNWLHASWGIGASAGPIIMTACVSNGSGWRMGYYLISFILAIMALLFFLLRSRWSLEKETIRSSEHQDVTVAMALRQPAVQLQLWLFFIYCGIESSGGQLLFSYYVESRNFPVPLGGAAITSYWASLTLGRVVFGQLCTSLTPEALLRHCALGAAIAMALIWQIPNQLVSLSGAALLGFCLAPIFPFLIALTPSRVGKHHSSHAVGFQIAAGSLGVALLPGLTASLASAWGLKAIAPALFTGTCVLVLSLKLSRNDGPVP